MVRLILDGDMTFRWWHGFQMVTNFHLVTKPSPETISSLGDKIITWRHNHHLVRYHHLVTKSSPVTSCYLIFSPSKKCLSPSEIVSPSDDFVSKWKFVTKWKRVHHLSEYLSPSENVFIILKRVHQVRSLFDVKYHHLPIFFTIWFPYHQVRSHHLAPRRKKFQNSRK